jgi:phage-related protein
MTRASTPPEKPLHWKGEGPGVFELVEDRRGGTWRVVYTVRFEKAVYALHCFQKKSPSGIRTAGTDVALIRRRLKTAREDYEVRYGKKA